MQITGRTSTTTLLREEYLKNLTLETAIDIGRMFEATRDGMQVMSGEDPRVEVNKLAWRNRSSRRSRETKDT